MDVHRYLYKSIISYGPNSQMGVLGVEGRGRAGQVLGQLEVMEAETIAKVAWMAAVRCGFCTHKAADVPD